MDGRKNGRAGVDGHRDRNAGADGHKDGKAGVGVNPSPWQAHFEELPAEVLERLTLWVGQFRDWNTKLNLVSRKDMDGFELRHLSAALVAGKVLKIKAGARLLDIGTGGGLPGLPLAICHPQASFTLVDSVGKKLRAVEAMADALGLDNVQFVHQRAEELGGQFDMVLGRAVTALPRFLGWSAPRLRAGAACGLSNGVLYWKGGDYARQLAACGVQPTKLWRLFDFLPEAYFEEKYLLYFSYEAMASLRAGCSAEAKKARKRI